MADTITPPRERYAPPPIRRRATLGDHVARLAPKLKATPGRAAAATLVAALLVVCLVALQPVEATGADDAGTFKAECGISLYLFGHPSPGVQQVCRDAYAGHAVAFFAGAGALLAALAALVVLLVRPVPAPRTDGASTWRAIVATPGRAAAMTVSAVLLVVALGSLLPAQTQGDSPRGAFSAQCGVSIFVFGHTDDAVQRACNDAYGTRGRTFFASVAAIAIAAVGVGASVHNERRRREQTVDTVDTVGAGPP